MNSQISDITNKYNGDKTRLMNILLDVQNKFGFISQENIAAIANHVGLSKVDVEQTVSFYHFFTQKSTGKFTIYLNDSLVSKFMGRDEIVKELEKATGTKFNSVSEDGLFGLFDTSCIGMNDQEPAAIINGIIFPKLTTYRVRELIQGFRKGMQPKDMVNSFGGGKNNSKLVKAMVNNNINRRGAVIFSDYVHTIALKKAVNMTPKEVIQVVKDSKIRGRGGAGFPTGMKWDFCTKSKAEPKYIICNADEGEPGTFKDRVIITERPRLLLEGMIIAGYAVGAKAGIIYLRLEYQYLKKHLESYINEFRENNWLGRDICGKKDFNFDIRIQMGAGSYVCGEESALIESCEGKRGEPRNRPPFPVKVGYLNKPTVVNNVETLCSVVGIIDHGAEWFTNMGTEDSSGTKVLSVSGDVKYPGIYEIRWGMTIKEMLEMVGAIKPKAVQVAGPSGSLIGKNQFHRSISYEDIGTGGAMIVIGKQRNILEVVHNFTKFFVEESCGSCAPCRYLSVILKNKLEKIMNGNGVMNDIEELKHWGKQMALANRCGLGQTAANPILSSIENFRDDYEALIEKGKDFSTPFDFEASLVPSSKTVKRFPSAY